MEAFNIQLTPMDRSTKHKISKETKALNDTIDQLDVIGIYKTFQPKTMNFTFFSSTHGTFWAINIALVNSKKLKSFQAAFLTTMQ